MAWILEDIGCTHHYKLRIMAYEIAPWFKPILLTPFTALMNTALCDGGSQ